MFPPPPAQVMRPEVLAQLGYLLTVTPNPRVVMAAARLLAITAPHAAHVPGADASILYDSRVIPALLAATSYNNNHRPNGIENGYVTGARGQGGSTPGGRSGSVTPGGARTPLLPGSSPRIPREARPAAPSGSPSAAPSEADGTGETPLSLGPPPAAPLQIRDSAACALALLELSETTVGLYAAVHTCDLYQALCVLYGRALEPGQPSGAVLPADVVALLLRAVCFNPHARWLPQLPRGHARALERHLEVRGGRAR